MDINYFVTFHNNNGERKIRYYFVGQIIMDYYPQRDRIEALKKVDDLGEASAFWAANRARFIEEGIEISNLISKHELDGIREMHKKGRLDIVKNRLLGLLEKAGVNIQDLNIPRL